MPFLMDYISLMGVIFVLDAIHEASEDSNDASIKSEADSVNSSSPGVEAINLVSTFFFWLIFCRTRDLDYIFYYLGNLISFWNKVNY